MEVTDKKFNDLVNSILGGADAKIKTKLQYHYWKPPKKWHGPEPLFAYTPWKIEYKGKVAYWAIVYRLKHKNPKTGMPLPEGTYVIVKAVRCGTRKRAKILSLKWYDSYYSKEKN